MTGAAALFAVGAILAGCSGSSLNFGLPSWFTQGSPAASQASASASSATPAISASDDCPTADIRTGAGTLAVAAKSQQPTANDLRYQLTFTGVARQCFIDGPNLRVRVGVQGRAVVGPAGAPPQISVPLRYAVVREGVEPKTIVTKFRRQTLALSPGTGNATFTDIEDNLSFPMPSPVELEAYVIYVGFDDLGDQQRPQAKKKSPKQR